MKQLFLNNETGRTEATLKTGIGNRLARTFAVTALLFLTTQLHANYRFYNMVQHVCKVYQIDVSMSDMQMETDYDSNIYFDMKMKAGRNNFDTVMMVGFLATGKALEKMPEMEMEGVNIRVTISSSRSNTLIIASAKANDIIRLAQGQISAGEFKTKYVTII